MPTYNAAAVSDATIAFQKPITLQQGRALRDNPLAAFEGAVSAPIISAGWHPFDMITNGDGNTGVIYDFAVSGAVTSVISPNFVDGYEYRFLLLALSCSVSAPLNLEWFRETSAGYSSPVAIVTVAITTNIFSGFVEAIRPRSTEKAFFSNHRYFEESPAINNQVINGASGMVVAHATAQKILRLRISMQSGSFDAGKILMYRRLAP